MGGQHLKGRFNFRPFQPWNVRTFVTYASNPFIFKILVTCGTCTYLKLPFKMYCNAEWVISASARANDNVIGGKQESHEIGHGTIRMCWEPSCWVSDPLMGKSNREKPLPLHITFNLM